MGFDNTSFQTTEQSASSPLPAHATDVFYYVCQCILALAIILVNGIVLHTLITKTRLHSPTNAIFGSHAMADILYGALRPLQALVEVGMYKSAIACIVISCLSVATGGISMQHLTLVSIDRYIMFTRPLAYPNIVTYKRVRMAMVSTWILTITISLIPVMGPRRPDFNDETLCSPESFMPLWYFIIMANITFLVCLSVITVLYFKIFRIAYSQNKRIEQEIHPQTSGVDIKVVVRSARLFATLCGYFTLSWTPYFLIRLLHVIYGEGFVHPVMDRLSVTIGTLNSLGNPLLYAFRQHDVRTQIQKGLPFIKKITHTDSVTTSET